MNINRDNYEEYFLLYADNELSAQEKNVVEAFVQKHPDVADEFLNIIQSVLKPENELKLESKSSLFRYTKKFIDHSNYQEVFLLYIDDELTSNEKNETEAFLAETPSLKNEFEVLEKAKLIPDKRIVFPNKKLLFKREHSGKVVPFKWWRAIAAAVLIGIGLWTGFTFYKKDTNEPAIAVKHDIAEKPVKHNPFVTDTIAPAKVVVTAGIKPLKRPAKPKITSANYAARLPAKKTGTDYQVAKDAPQTNNLPHVSGIINNDKKEIHGIVAKEVSKSNYENIVEDNNGDNDTRQLQEDDLLTADKNAVPNVVTASYTADGNKNSNNNYAFYNVTEEKFNKSKIGGFLRKVKRVIERKISPLSSSKSQREMAVN